MANEKGIIWLTAKNVENMVDTSATTLYTTSLTFLS